MRNINSTSSYSWLYLRKNKGCSGNIVNLRAMKLNFVMIRGNVKYSEENTSNRA